MKAFKCDECKKYFEGLRYAVMKLETGISEIVLFEYDLCEKCYKKIKEARDE